MKNIVIIGSGQIGSRHLQGLAKINEDLDITVIDPSIESLSIASERYLQVEELNAGSSVSFKQEIPTFKKLDLAIIATSSNIRKKVIKRLLEISSPNYFIIEKVAFQNLKDFVEIINIFKEKGIISWVNCPNRAFESYKNLKESLDYEGPLKMHVSGGNWGLASNAIHYLDLFSFFVESIDLEVIESSIDDIIYPSKREGFLELGGTFIIKSRKNDLLTIEDIKSSNKPVTITISTQNHRIIINELLGESQIKTKKNSWRNLKSAFELTNQSTLTTDIVLKIFKEETSDLIDLEESYRLHKLIIPLFLDKINKISNTVIEDCPIT